MPKITVIVTTYNLEHFIAKFFDELFAQTFQDFNILVVDDCSKDDTVNIVRNYMERYPGRITDVFLEENLGKPALARNVALDSGKIDSEFIVFLDGDDSIEPEYLETLHDLIQEPGTDIAVCAYDRVEFDTGRVRCVEMQKFPEVIEKPLESEIAALINAAIWNKLIRVSLIADTRFSNISVGEDACFMLRLYTKCRKIRFTSQVLIHYKVHRASVISNTKLKDIHDFAEELKKLYNESSNVCRTDIIEQSAFLHIGMSMAIRANESLEINTREHLSWTRTYFVENFKLFKGSRFLHLSSLRNRGMRGWGIWFCLLLYRIYIPGFFLLLYDIYTKTTRKDIKY